MSARDRVVDHAERLRAATAQLGCTRSEAVALAVLVGGAVLALGLLWLAARGGAPPAAAPAEQEAAATADAAEDRPGARTGAEGAPAGGAPEAAAEGAGASDLVVHVSGLVAEPGVHYVPDGGRVADAIAAAGGALPGAHLEGLNLARPLADGEQIHVAAHGDPAAPEGAAQDPDGAGAAWLPDGRLDINRATESDFEELPGIGPVLAERIVAHREEVGGFESIGDLLGVRGIGEKTLAALSDLLGP